MKKARKPKKKKITEKKTEKPIKKKVSKAEVKKVKIRPERVMETEVEIEPQNRFELIERVETFPEKKEVVEKAKKIKKKAKKIRKHKIKEKEMKPEKIRKPEMKKEIKHKRKTKIQKEEVKPKKRIGGGSFIASGVLSILVPAMFYVVLGDFGAFLQDCSL
ncbi:MAG: hypothetical protein GTN36_06490, partial [Candidatus Aenigmarchaeota archaeon]|nr:hypothetical protein [Candidatus Aenigmarchaeota archaeon]